jgi:A/G-specific adenine glycosylase
MDITPRQKSLIIVRILRWYRKYGRDLPWRNVHDPYRILVSEVMLQQTQVSRVLTKYRGFLRRFPSLRRLAKAKTSDVIKSWEGMGYNSRALRLQKLAVIILEEHKGKLPESIQELETLPGIGRYTAHALACFSFGQHVPIVDTNVKRVLTRVCHPRDRASVTGKEDIWDLADSLLPPQQSHDWNQALMDLGATICTAAQPRCNHCPLVDLCPSAHRVRRREPVTKKTEPGRGGIPNRIYRGRTIQALRELKTHGATTRSALARRVKPDFKSTDRPWFEFLLQALEKDGLIRIRARNRISLPE